MFLFILSEDWESTFAGNNDDHFRIGLSITRKRLQLYTEFYKSDIIIASPLGLRTLIGTKGLVCLCHTSLILIIIIIIIIYSFIMRKFHK